MSNIDRVSSFLSDESGGERDTLTTMLILALIIVPLLIVIVAFGTDIQEYAQSKWEEIMGNPVPGS